MTRSISNNTSATSRQGPYTGKAILLTLMFCWGLVGCGGTKLTSTNGQDTPRQFDKALEEADNYRKIGQCQKASDIYRKLSLKYSRPEPHVGLALCAKQQYDRETQYSEFEKALHLDSESPSLLFATGESAYLVQKYDRGQNLLNQYLDMQTADLKTQAKARKILDHISFIEHNSRSYPHLQMRPLPQPINTRYLEYLPSVDARESKIIFTRRLEGQEDLFEAQQTDSLGWVVTPLSHINTHANESGQCVSADGRTILYTICDPEKTIGACDLYMSTTDSKGRWTIGQHLEAPINSEYWEAQPSISSDGRYLVFASSRPGGQGGRDLWLSRLDTTHQRWSTPVNLGAAINTSGNEETPFLHPDQKTLYFRSDGHSGFGGYDLFVSRLESGKWSTPENLGTPINNPGDQGSIVVNLQGDKAYFASETDKENHFNTRGDIDLLTFKLPEDIRPTPMTFVEFVVRDAQTQKPVNGVLTLINPQTDKSLWTGPIKDKEMICVPLGEHYGIQVTSPGYLFYSEEVLVDTNQARHSLPIVRVIDMIKTTDIGVQRPVALENVLFEVGSSVLLPVAYRDLDELAALLRTYSSWAIEIHGHTDDSGTTEENLILSEERAQSVKTYLVNKGISPRRITTKGFGESQPIADNDTIYGRAKNRRVEFIIQSD